jgi:hypothetical protein
MAPHSPYYSLAQRTLLSRYNDRFEGPLTALTIALHRGLYLDIIMDRYERTDIPLTIALQRIF